MENTSLQLADICDLENSAYTLLDSMLKSFIEKSYYIWKAGIDIRRANEERKVALEIVQQRADQLHKEKLREQYSMIDAISSIYQVVWVYDLTKGTIKVIRQAEELHKPAHEAEFDARETIENVITQCVEKEDQEEMRQFYNLDMLAQRLCTEPSVSKDFRDTIMGWCRIIAIPVEQQAGELPQKIMIGIQRIDEEKRKELNAQKLLSKAYEEAKRANAAKTEFLSRMSHDIRTPMNGILGMAKIAEKSIHDPNRVLDALHKIDQAGKQLEMLINDVLDMSRLESGRTELTREPFDIVQVLNNNYVPIRVMAEEKQIRLLRPHANITHRNLIGSPLHLQRILLNILTNAVKYNKPNGTIEAWLNEIPRDERHSDYELIIADSGIGMSQEYLEHVYEPFSRGTRDSGTHYQGTGLGMAITKEIVDLMGGTIDVESRVGVATTFRIKVPFELGADEYVQQKDSGTETDISLEHMKILMAEDNELNIEIAMFMLEEAGAEVTVARNGKEAYLTWQNAPIDCYDVILMDIMMPEMNGIQAAECIRKSNRQDAGRIPIVAMTANAFAEDIKRCRAAGMNDHLAKPLDIQKLYRTLARYHRSAYSE